MVTLYIQKAKDRYIARELALLRANNPTPQMVSHLDEVDDTAIEESVRRVIEARSQAASHPAASATVPPLSVPMCSSSLASQVSCDPETPAIGSFSPTSQASCDPETPAMQDPSPSTSQASCDTSVLSPIKFNPARTADQQAKGGRRRSVLRTPNPGCRNCQFLSAELKVVKDLLQIEIETMSSSSYILQQCVQL